MGLGLGSRLKLELGSALDFSDRYCLKGKSPEGARYLPAGPSAAAPMSLDHMKGLASLPAQSGWQCLLGATPEGRLGLPDHQGAQKRKGVQLASIVST